MHALHTLPLHTRRSMHALRTPHPTHPRERCGAIPQRSSAWATRGPSSFEIWPTRSGVPPLRSVTATSSRCGEIASSSTSTRSRWRRRRTVHGHACRLSTSGRWRVSGRGARWNGLSGPRPNEKHLQAGVTSAGSGPPRGPVAGEPGGSGEAGAGSVSGRQRGRQLMAARPRTAAHSDGPDNGTIVRQKLGDSSVILSCHCTPVNCLSRHACHKRGRGATSGADTSHTWTQEARKMLTKFGPKSWPKSEAQCPRR